MSLYAIDISYINPSDGIPRRKLYENPSAFLARENDLDRSYKQKQKDIELNALIDDATKQARIDELDAQYQELKAALPAEDAMYVTASVMTGVCYSFRHYENIQELEEELTKSQERKHTWMNDPSRKEARRVLAMTNPENSKMPT